MARNRCRRNTDCLCQSANALKLLCRYCCVLAELQLLVSKSNAVLLNAEDGARAYLAETPSLGCEGLANSQAFE